MNKKIVSLIVILVGSVILVLTLPGIISSVRLKKHGVSAESIVLRRSGNKGLSTVTVSFNTPDGKQVTAKASKRNYVSSGEKVMIYYDPAFPQKIDFGDTISYNMRGAIFGVLLFILGFYLIVLHIFRDTVNNRLIRSGRKVAAEFVSVDRNEKYRMGDNTPWVIKCRWVDSRDNQEYFFQSKDYLIDPVPYLNGRYHIDVFIDPADPGKYYMDTSFMPKGNNTLN
jgi:hypothetical protein